eukprot:1422355-Rhodomonas_salina.1
MGHRPGPRTPARSDSGSRSGCLAQRRCVTDITRTLLLRHCSSFPAGSPGRKRCRRGAGRCLGGRGGRGRGRGGV